MSGREFLMSLVVLLGLLVECLREEGARRLYVLEYEIGLD